MKKYSIYLFGALAIAGMGLVSCSSDPEYDDTETINVSEAQFSYDSEGVWEDNNVSGFLNIDDYEFSHYKEDTYGTVYGFTPSRVADSSLHDPLSSFPYASVSGGGVNGAGSQYLVGYWTEYLESEDTPFDKRSCRIYNEEGDTFKPVSVMVCNTSYFYFSLLNGTFYSPAAKPGDWVTLTAHGVHEDGTEAEAVFYLANIEGTDVAPGMLTSWKKFNLSQLGVCTGIYFTMECSKSFQDGGGMTVPSYFCLDKLVVKE